MRPREAHAAKALRADFREALRMWEAIYMGPIEGHAAHLGGLDVRPLSRHFDTPPAHDTNVLNHPNFLSLKFLEQFCKIPETILVTLEHYGATEIFLIIFYLILSVA
jgi:hypothetical protein